VSVVRATTALRRVGAGVLGLGLAACQAPSEAPAESLRSHHQLIRSHLARIVETKDFNCALVVEHVRNQALDYQALCDDGRAYRVWVGAEGQVLVQPLNDAARSPPAPRSAQPPASAPG
jgi:hypothetical protein